MINGDYDEVTDKINKLYQQKQYNEVIAEAMQLLDGSHCDLSLDLRNKIALAYFRTGNYTAALSLFEEISQTKNDLMSWFNVMTSAILAQQIQKGKDAYQRTLEIRKADQTSQQPSSIQTCYYYTCALADIGAYYDAMSQLEVLKSVYIKLVITDTTFLYLRSVPFLSDTLDLAKRVFEGLGQDFTRSEWLDDLERHIDDEGKQIIAKYHHMI